LVFKIELWEEREKERGKTYSLPINIIHLLETIFISHKYYLSSATLSCFPTLENVLQSGTTIQPKGMLSNPNTYPNMIKSSYANSQQA